LTLKKNYICEERSMESFKNNEGNRDELIIQQQREIEKEVST